MKTGLCAARFFITIIRDETFGENCLLKKFMLNKNLKRRHSSSSSQSSSSSSSSICSSNSLTEEENNNHSSNSSLNRNQQQQTVATSSHLPRNVNLGGSIHGVVMANATVISPNDLKASGQKVFQANPSPGHQNVPQKKKKRKSPSQKQNPSSSSSGTSPSSSNTNHSLPNNSNHTHDLPSQSQNNDTFQNSALRSKITSEQIAYCPSCAFIGNKSHLPQSVLSVSVETNFNSQTVSLNERYEPIYHQFLVKLVVTRPFNRLSFHLNSFESKNSVVFNVNREPSPIEDGNIHQLAISFSSIYLSEAILTDPLISSTNLPFLTEKSVKPFIHFGNIDCKYEEILWIFSNCFIIYFNLQTTQVEEMKYLFLFNFCVKIQRNTCVNITKLRHQLLMNIKENLLLEEHCMFKLLSTSLHHSHPMDQLAAHLRF